MLLCSYDEWQCLGGIARWIGSFCLPYAAAVTVWASSRSATLTWSTGSRPSCPVAARRAPSVAWCSVPSSPSPAVPKRCCRSSLNPSHAVSISLSISISIYPFNSFSCFPFLSGFPFYFSSLLSQTIFSSFSLSFQLYFFIFFHSFSLCIYLTSFFLLFFFIFVSVFLFLCPNEICSKFSLKFQQQHEKLKHMSE